jgi:hypothetical protein
MAITMLSISEFLPDYRTAYPILVESQTMMESSEHLTLPYSHGQGHPTRAALHTSYLLVLVDP